MLLEHLKDRKILVLAGHVNKDYGTTGLTIRGETHYTNEAELNLDIAFALYNDLKAHTDGTARVMLGHGSWARRARLDYLFKPDAVLEIHCNGYEEADVDGFELWVDSTPHSHDLAEHIEEKMKEGNPIESRGIKDIYLEDNPRRALWEHIETRPCVLVECGFVTNRNNCHLITHQEYQRIVALKICFGLNEFFSPKLPSDEFGIGGGSAENDE